MNLLTVDMFGTRKAIYKKIEVFPTKEEISSMSKAGYKFFLDGKKVTYKKVIEIIKGEENNGND